MTPIIITIFIVSTSETTSADRTLEPEPVEVEKARQLDEFIEDDEREKIMAMINEHTLG